MKAYLSLGSNLGDRESNLSKAISLLEKNCGIIKKLSRIYETEPWGFESEHWFLNMALELETALSPFQLLRCTQKIEQKLGRKEKSVNGYKPRIIDIDIIFYDSLIINTPELKIPHQHLHERLFVLRPLYDLNPHFLHPLLNMTVAELLDNCTDQTIIYKKDLESIFEPSRS